MKREWLIKKIDSTDIVSIFHEEIRQMGMNENDEREFIAKGPDPRTRKHWDEFIREMQASDELWYFKSPAETWANLAGRAGYAIVRSGEIVKHYVTMLN